MRNLLLLLFIFTFTFCNPRIITRTISKDSTLVIKRDTSFIRVNDTIIKNIIEYREVVKNIFIKEDCKTKMEVRQEQRIKRDSIIYNYKTIRDTVLINNRTKRQENRQNGRTNRGFWIWILLIIISFLAGYFLKQLKTKQFKNGRIINN